MSAEAVASTPAADEYSFWQKLAAEAIGTFFLVWVGAGTVTMTLIISQRAPRYNVNDIGIGALGGAGDWLAIASAFGFVILAMVYFFGHVSGAHMNPGVTLALLARREIGLRDSVGYWVAQFAGAIVGAFGIALIFGHQGWDVGGLGAAAPFPGIARWRAGIAEGIGQFALVLGVFGMAVNRKAPSGWAGLVIGLNVAGLILVLGNVSGGAINPARTVGPIFGDWVLGGPNLWSSAWVYVIAQIVGSLVAAAVYPAVAIFARGAHRGAAPAPEPLSGDRGRAAR